jgi:hypothetical protein
MKLTLALLAIGSILCCTGEPRAETPITPGLICQVKGAIRWKAPAWDRATCEQVALAINETPRPRTTLAMAILESDLRMDVAVEARPGVFDVGLLGVRCLLSPGSSAPARGDGPRSAGDSKLADEAVGRCQNGPARGYTLAELKTPAINVRVAAEIMAEKRERHGKNWARFYSGASHENGYGRRVAVLAAALGGARLTTKCKRVRRLAELILAAVRPRIAMETVR